MKQVFGVTVVVVWCVSLAWAITGLYFFAEPPATFSTDYARAYNRGDFSELSDRCSSIEVTGVVKGYRRDPDTGQEVVLIREKGFQAPTYLVALERRLPVGFLSDRGPLDYGPGLVTFSGEVVAVNESGVLVIGNVHLNEEAR